MVASSMSRDDDKDYSTLKQFRPFPRRARDMLFSGVNGRPVRFVLRALKRGPHENGDALLCQWGI